MDLDYPSDKMIDLNNNCISNESKSRNANRNDGKGPLKCGSKDSGIGSDNLASNNDGRLDGDHLSHKSTEPSICSKSLLEQHVEELSELLSGSSKTNSIIDDATPNSATANLLVNADLSPVTAIESVAVSSMSASHMDQSPNDQSSLLDESNLIDSNGDELDFDDSSLGNVTQCFNIKTESDDTLLNETGRLSFGIFLFNYLNLLNCPQAYLLGGFELPGLLHSSHSSAHAFQTLKRTHSLVFTLKTSVFSNHTLCSDSVTF